MPRPKKPLPADSAIVIGYVGPRVSAADQRVLIEAEASRRELTLVSIFEDTCACALPDRSGFVDALSAAEGGRVGVFVTVNVGVLATNAAEHALAARAIERSGAVWQPIDAAVAWTAAAVAEVQAVLRLHESLIYRPKVRLGRRRGAAVRPGGPAPWGYARDEHGQFVADEAEQKAVADAVRMRAEGVLPSKIAMYLQSLRLPGRSPKVYKSTVNAIFKRIDRGSA